MVIDIRLFGYDLVVVADAPCGLLDFRATTLPTLPTGCQAVSTTTRSIARASLSRLREKKIEQ